MGERRREGEVWRKGRRKGWGLKEQGKGSSGDTGEKRVGAWEKGEMKRWDGEGKYNYGGRQGAKRNGRGEGRREGKEEERECERGKGNGRGGRGEGSTKWP